MRDGRQVTAGRTRQKWRCIAPDGSHHRFVGAVARTRHAPEAVCWECDNAVQAHEGPVAPYEFEYLVRDVATSLVAVGRGMTYTNAAVRVRQMADRALLDQDPSWQPPRERKVTNGQTVSEWVGEFSPVVAARHAETEWPETLVLDSTRFLYTNTWTGRSRELFVVMAAWGYPAGATRGRLWKLWASPAGDEDAWAEFLDQLPGRPAVVVCDRDYGIINGVKQHWGSGKNAGPIHLCEHHLFERGKAAMNRDGLAFEDPIRVAFRAALHSRPEWEAFERLAHADPTAIATQAWVHHWRARMLIQTARRASLPPHYANGAVEAPLRHVIDLINRRKFSFRNRARMNALLELLRLRELGVDSDRAYAEDIRAHLVREGPNRARRYRTIYDTWGPKVPGVQRLRTYSLYGESRYEGDW